MKQANAQTVFTFVAVISLASLGCSDTSNEKPASNARTELDEEAETRVVLEDRVYPVVLADGAMPMSDKNFKVVELVNVPVDGSGDSTPDKIQVIPQPLLRFGRLSHFDFKFEKNQCTQVGFQNTDELKEYTRDHVGSRLAVVIDCKVISHHKIQEAIEGDEVRITCCTVGGGDHLHKHLKELKFASNANGPSQANDDSTPLPE